MGFLFGMGNLVYLQDSSVTLNFHSRRRHKIYDSPWTRAVGNYRAFQYPDDIDMWTGRIPDDADIVVTHGPPWDHLDDDIKGKRRGDKHLLRELRRVKRRLAVFGHVHTAYAEARLVHYGVRDAYEDICFYGGGVFAILRMWFWAFVA